MLFYLSALVPLEVDNDDNIGAGAHIDSTDAQQVVYLPLTDSEGKIFPIHFLSTGEVGAVFSFIVLTVLLSW